MASGSTVRNVPMEAKVNLLLLAKEHLEGVNA